MIDDSAALDELLVPVIFGLPVPGTVVAICDRNGMVWHHARGHIGPMDRDGAAPAGLDTVFGVSSVTKTFTAAAILALRDAGALSLDEPLYAIVPEARALQYPTTDCAPITIRHIWTHTAGLPRSVRHLRGHVREEPGEADLLQLLPAVRLERAPHVERADSHLGYALLGLVVARRGGISYRTFIEERIAQPLGMTTVTFDPTRASERLATPHKNRRGVLGPNSLREHGVYVAAEGLYTSVRDLTRWLTFQLSAWPPRDDPDAGLPLKRSTVRESHRVGGLQRVGRNDFGLGWSIERGALGDLVFQDSTGTMGYKAFIAFEPDLGIGIVAAANAEIELSDSIVRTLGAFAASRGLIDARRQ